MTLELTLACGDYEILRALKDGVVQPEGIKLNVDTRLGPKDRHWAMAKENAFDICEFNAPAYFMARDRGMKWTALPVFAHRRFRHGFIFVRQDSPLTDPSELAGKRIGGTNFQPAGNVWVRGILEEHYDVPHKSVAWFTERGEDIDFTPHEGLHIQRIRDDQTLDQMLFDGELDALIQPEFPQPFVKGDPRMRRLLSDHKAVEMAYYEKTGFFPIMHVTVIKQNIVDEHPWVAQSLMKAFEEAKTLAYKRVDNPRVVPLAWWAHAWEEQKRILGNDPWEYGLTERNRANLETLMGYAHTQGLVSRRAPLEEVFTW
jgi:4,5-dihydroxyphthalate decarboxylase